MMSPLFIANTHQNAITDTIYEVFLVNMYSHQYRCTVSAGWSTASSFSAKQLQ